MNLAGWLQALAAAPLLTFLGAAVMAGAGMLFGRVLPWVTQDRKVNNDIALDKLKQLEDSLDRDTRRAASLIRGFEDEPEPPSGDALARLGVKDQLLAKYQQVRYQTAQDLPMILEDLRQARESIVAARKRLYGGPKKSNMEATFSRIEESAARSDARLNEVVERLAGQSRVYWGKIPPKDQLRKGDMFVMIDDEQVAEFNKDR